MKRRTLLGSLALGAGAGLGLPRAARTEAGETRRSPQLLQQLENEHLRFRLFDDASAEIVERDTGALWRMGRVALQEDGPIDVGHVWLRQERSIVEQYPGRFRGRVEGDAARFTLVGRLGREMGTFACRFRLEGPWLELRLLEVGGSLQSLVFPPPIESESLVVPRDVGQWIKKPLASRFFWALGGHLNMRWVGGLRGERGWLCVFDEGHADAGVLATGLAVSPAWRRSLGTWSGPRGVRYRLTTGGYVGLAKAYRAWASERGLMRTLAEKADRHPDLRHLFGGRQLSVVQAQTRHAADAEDHLRPVTAEDLATDGQVRAGVTHAEAARILEEARGLGMKNGLFLVRGWIRGGYDESHPDVWPPEASLGTEEELRALCRRPGEIVVGLHDNYQDIYARSPSFPRGVVRTASGELMAGGYWAGGQSYILNSRDGLAYARRNWPLIAGLGPRAFFTDTTSAAQLYESWEDGNRLTRAQDEGYKADLLRFLGEQGRLVGSEEGADFAVPHVDWFENRHRRLAGQSVPLWPLVFHDAALCLRYSDPAGFAADSGASGRGAPHWLADVLWGYLLAFGWVSGRREWEAMKAGFRSTFHVDAWHARVATAELTSHRYLADDGEVEETRFSNGAAVAVNFSGEERRADGLTLPAHGYAFRD